MWRAAALLALACPCTGLGAEHARADRPRAVTANSSAGSAAPQAAPPEGNFTQKVCGDAACSAGCSSQSFPVGQCLQVAGGSSVIVAHCSPKGIVMKVFSLSGNCSGLYPQMQTQPVGACMRDTQGGWFENFCTGGAHPAGRLLHISP
eukprot:TRINITY_DN13697_c0_g1_i1.p2 TRINITY_DN13697_c0_g1~~TRINITY_DN13697_c0_g1_i1.p2  ORF type:complete len:174 (+),score=57.40 TRINITY_DN13697_c0_g1_i1:80-523(+)